MTTANHECDRLQRRTELLHDAELETVSGGKGSLMTTVLTNIANMKHESLKAIAQNLRG